MAFDAITLALRPWRVHRFSGPRHGGGMSGDPAQAKPMDPTPASRARPAASVAEVVVVFLVALVTVAVGWRLVGDDPLARQAVVWVANVLMLGTVWAGLRRRGQTGADLGLAVRRVGARTVLRAVLQSLAVVTAAVAAFVVGGVVATPLAAGAAADMSSYVYLQGNLPMLLLALAAVWIVSSFGEEVIYRGFLMTRVAEVAGGGRTGWWTAVAVSAVVFGLVHFDWGVVGIIQTAFLGVALGIGYLLVRRNLWVLVLAHAYIDTLLLVQLYAGAS
jgi:membrane protease YdiL (CAAX protease family)